MAPATSAPAPAASPFPFDPRNQTFYLEGPGNMTIPVWVPDVDMFFNQAINTTINYACQIGACFIMLLVTLTMTSKSRFSRASTIINIASLVIGTIRTTLLTLYFVSSFLEFYTFFSHSYDVINPNDTRISAVATFFALPQLILIEAALFLQAYSMIKLWPRWWRFPVLALSALIAGFSIGFKCASVAIHMQSILGFYVSYSEVWVSQADLIFSATTFFWFCFVFIIRLVIHMWEFRSILPPMGGVSAMEVLVMTNGVLMLVPVVFAAMDVAHVGVFQPGSLIYTSVIVLLPLGSLIAQSMTRPDGYIVRSNNSDASGGNSRGMPRGGSGLSGLGPGGNNSRGGAYSRAATNTANTVNTVDSKTGIMGGSHSQNKNYNATDFGTWSHASDANSTNAMISGGMATQVRIHSNQSENIVPGSRARNNSLAVLDPIEKQLQEIDATPLSSSTTEGRVWVDREVEVRRDMV